MKSNIRLIRGNVEEVQSEIDHLMLSLKTHPTVESVISIGNEVLITLSIYY